MTEIERILKNIVPEPNSGCWLWAGSATGHDGYGVLTSNRRRQLAHRFMYEQANGPFDQSLFVCHKCNTKPCCNPEHLYLANNQQNIIDAFRDGLITPANSKKTACTKCGGPYQVSKDGRRFCRRCRTRNNTLHKSQKRLAARSAAQGTK